MRARFLILSILVLSALTLEARSEPIPKPAPVEKKATPKTVKVVFVNASWREVFQWLTKETGKPICSCTPSGRFTFVGPPDKEYTIPEGIAIINDGLAKHPQQFILIEHKDGFSLPTRDQVVGGK